MQSARASRAHQLAPHVAPVLRRSVQQSRLSTARRHTGAGFSRRRDAVQPRSVRCTDLRCGAHGGSSVDYARRRDPRVGRREGDLVIERAIAAATHGRYLVDVPSTGGPWPLLVGFHGYGEGASPQLERLRSTPGADRWLLVAVQGLHRFYRGRTNDVVAGWMT